MAATGWSKAQLRCLHISVGQIQLRIFTDNPAFSQFTKTIVNYEITSEYHLLQKSLQLKECLQFQLSFLTLVIIKLQVWTFCLICPGSFIQFVWTHHLPTRTLSQWTT